MKYKILQREAMERKRDSRHYVASPTSGNHICYVASRDFDPSSALTAENPNIHRFPEISEILWEVR